MQFLKRQWRSRTLILLALGVLTSLAMWGLEFTDWAAELNAATGGEAEGEGRDIPSAARMVLPFVKVFVLMAVPASLVIGIRALFSKLARRQSSGA